MQYDMWLNAYIYIDLALKNEGCLDLVFKIIS